MPYPQHWHGDLVVLRFARFDFGLNGKIEKSFLADAFHPGEGAVLEVEAGRAIDNNQFLKDLFQACMMSKIPVYRDRTRVTW